MKWRWAYLYLSSECVKRRNTIRKDYSCKEQGIPISLWVMSQARVLAQAFGEYHESQIPRSAAVLQA